MKDEYGEKSFLKFVGLKSKSFKNFTIYYLRKRFLDTQ